MSALMQSLLQLAVGFTVVGVPFLAGACWQAGRADGWRRYALDLLEEIDELRDALDAHPSQPRRLTPRLSVVPDPCRACGARDGWHDHGCGLLDRLDAGHALPEPRRLPARGRTGASSTSHARTSS
jgi:hypothetical protein